MLRILSSSWDKTICFHDLETGNVIWRGVHDGIVMSCDLSTNGKYAVSCADYEDSIKMWDVRDGKIAQLLPGITNNRSFGLLPRSN